MAIDRNLCRMKMMNEIRFAGSLSNSTCLWVLASHCWPPGKRQGPESMSEYDLSLPLRYSQTVEMDGDEMSDKETMFPARLKCPLWWFQAKVQ